jgi:hypothetical protein
VSKDEAKNKDLERKVRRAQRRGLYIKRDDTGEVATTIQRLKNFSRVIETNNSPESKLFQAIRILAFDTGYMLTSASDLVVSGTERGYVTTMSDENNPFLTPKWKAAIQEALKERFDAIDAKLVSIGNRVDDVDAKFVAVDKRFDTQQLILEDIQKTLRSLAVGTPNDPPEPS